MIRVRAPCVKYASVHELVCSCALVLDEYKAQVDAAVREIWNAKHVAKKWTSYDRLMLGIFHFDEVVASGEETLLQSTKGKGAIYACTKHREICMLLNQANRDYIHSTAAPDSAELLLSLHRVLTGALLMGRSSHMMCVMRESMCRCRDADGGTWLVCPRHELSGYALAVCMSQHRRLGAGAELHAIPADILRPLLTFLFAQTSWDSHPMDSQVEVGVPF
jgi:hypothetical protein